VALQEPARVEAGELAPGPRGRPPPAEQVAGVTLAIGDAVPSLEDLLAGMVVAERGAREGVAHPLAGGVVAGLRLGARAGRGEGPRRGRGGEVEEQQQGQKQEEGEGEDDEGAPPRPRCRAPRRRCHGGGGGRGWASEADLGHCAVGLHYTARAEELCWPKPKHKRDKYRAFTGRVRA
jgi:hypothetical protein